MDIDFDVLYAGNTDFKRYVDRYCEKHRCTVEVALTHYLVRMAGNVYWEQEKQN